MKSPVRIGGFTLIELMLVVAIIALLAAIAIPKFANLVLRAKEASNKGKLGTLRSAVSIYYSDNEGTYPATPPGVGLSLTPGGKYLDEIPIISIPTAGHAAVHAFGSNPTHATFANDSFYGWGFYPPSGLVVVNCTHTDSNGTTWSLW